VGNPDSTTSSRVSDSSGDSDNGDASSTTRRARRTPGHRTAHSTVAPSSSAVSRASASAASAATSPARTPALRAMSMTVRATTVIGMPNHSVRSSSGSRAECTRMSRSPPPFPVVVSRGRAGVINNGRPCIAAALSWLTVSSGRTRAAAAARISTLVPNCRPSPAAGGKTHSAFRRGALHCPRRTARRISARASPALRAWSWVSTNPCRAASARAGVPPAQSRAIAAQSCCRCRTGPGRSAWPRSSIMRRHGTEHDAVRVGVRRRLWTATESSTLGVESPDSGP
jgi:hypothetical protein